MSFESALQRVSELDSLLDAPSTGASLATQKTDAGAFSQLLSAAQERQLPEGMLPSNSVASGLPMLGADERDISSKYGGLGGGMTAGAGYGYPGVSQGYPGVSQGYPGLGSMPGMAGGFTSVYGGYPTVGGFPGMTGVPGPGYYPGIQGVGSPWMNGYSGSELGQRIVQMAQNELGVAESPAGSNNSERIAEYRTATAGAANTPGPWCAYFVSWLCNQAGAPIGHGGNGTGYVPTLESWGRSEGRWIDGSQQPSPGDIVIFNWGASGVSDHTGIVERVDPDGTVHTIEGNSSNMVARRDYPAGSNDVKGFVRPG